MPEPSPAPNRLSFSAGVTAIAATYVYFLLYAQFGLVYLMQERGATVTDIEHAMGAMGLTGLLASLLCARWLKCLAAATLLRIGYATAAFAAIAGILLPGVQPLVAMAGLVGLGTALVTVPLAASLGMFFPRGRLGLGAGLGTGLAYAICNIPGVFSGTPQLQSIAVSVFCLAGYWAAGQAGKRPGSEAPAVSPGMRLAFAGALLCFFALVWMDATAFAVIQRTEGLKAHTWEGPRHQIFQGLTHLLAAVLAGRLIDRGFLTALWPVTATLFLLALPALQTAAAPVWSGPLYAMGISFYSVALVAYPALAASSTGPSGAVRAALVYGIAGWVASGLGVGLAQHLHVLPSWFFLAVAAAVLAGWFLNRRGNISSSFWIAAAALAALVLGPATEPPGADPVERGRRVYIEEGCIHCHSQYVRPGDLTRDVLWWGPERALDRSEKPPMVGNRRQGPDLTHVGARRSPEWLRLHFIDPVLLRPGSRMPAYAHLFAAGSTRGDDLIAYLMTRGQGMATELWTLHNAWSLPVASPPADPIRGAADFAQHCTGCHGVNADGKSPLAPVLNRPALNLRKGYFQYVPRDCPPEQQKQALARIVKFGVPGTTMAGHEWFSQGDVADLTAWLQSLAP